MTKRLILMLVAVTVVFGAVFGMKWFGNKMMVQAIENMPVPPVTISTALADAAHWPRQIEAVGTLMPVNGADLTAEAAGTVTAIQFESGAQVRKGELLLTLDGRVERGELARLVADAEVAKLNLERMRTLVERRMVAQSEYDLAVANAAAAAAAAEAQRGRVALKQVRAPFDGQLGVRRVSLGQYLAVGTPVVTLQSLSPIDLDFRLPEQFLAVIAKGQSVSAQIEGHDTRKFSGTVLAIEPKVDVATRNFTIRARMPNEDALLRPGQFARITVALAGDADVIALPRTAINYSSYGTSVFVVTPRAADAKADAPLTVEQRIITLGEARGDFVAVIRGLEKGEEVASTGLLKLRNQQPVIIDNQNAPAAELAPTPPQG